MRELQGYLKALGFYDGEPSGSFDDKTADAVAAYRKSKGSEAPGAFGRGLSVELLYAVGSEGDLVCVETATGRERWRRNLVRDFGGRMMSGWKFSEWPLVDGNTVIVTPGGAEAALVALRPLQRTAFQGPPAEPLAGNLKKQLPIPSEQVGVFVASLQSQVSALARTMEVEGGTGGFAEQISRIRETRALERLLREDSALSYLSVVDTSGQGPASGTHVLEQSPGAAGGRLAARSRGSMRRAGTWRRAEDCQAAKAARFRLITSPGGG